jgi:hypothetical protein
VSVVYGLGKRYEVRIYSNACWTIFKSFSSESEAMGCLEEVCDFNPKRRAMVFDALTGATKQRKKGGAK